MKFIPIIGTISSGKSTFLQGLLGTDVLETGQTTTTKFVCLIKNSAETKFYPIILKRDNLIKFEKKENDIEILGEENIKEKIKEINKNLSKTPITKDNIFYMLEIPIKNIGNASLLQQCYFMDIPGLNEYKSPYIDIIFSILTFDDIQFEIIVFDSNFKGDSILHIFEKLEEKKCLKKVDNLFILNKIDKVKQKEEEDVISDFEEYFYEHFEDDKNKNNHISINLSENQFIPMNSLLFLAETKIKEDFCSLLIAGFFIYIATKEKGQLNNYYKYIEKKIKWLKEQYSIIDLDINLITDEEFKIIEKSIKELDKIKKATNATCSINIDLNNNNVKNNMVTLFLLYKNKNKNIYYNYSKYYNNLQTIIKEIKINNNDNFNIINIDEQNNIGNNNKKIIDCLDKFDNFLKETFKLIDPDNELKNLNSSLQSLREGIIGRKIRIPFIGNISVGKSTILNCIIGEDILPINYKECTYRGIIIRHIEKGSFKLYKTELKTRGQDYDKYYYFKEEKKPYREGIKEIKSYLSAKNKDKNIEDKDAYFVITGHLKIFDFIKLDEELISKIEFIDLPGLNIKNNTFNEHQYYEKILRFSNCCIYVNEANTIDDDDSVRQMIKQYLSDKEKIIPKLKNDFIKTCVFLINKSDELDNNSKEKIKNNIKNNIIYFDGNVKKDKINISFFSGINFFKYLKTKNDYVNILKDEPKKLLLYFFKEYHLNFKYLYNDFKTFIFEIISGIKEEFILNNIEGNQQEDELMPPEDFKNYLKSEIEKFELEHRKLFKNGDYDELIKKLYNVHIKFKQKDFSNTNYSSKFFDDLRRAILNSEKIYKENLENTVINFLNDTDILFKKELNLDTEQIQNNKIENLEKTIELNKKINNFFKKAKTNIKKLLNDSKSQIIGIISSEINDIPTKLRESNNDVKIAAENLKIKVDELIAEINNSINKEISNIYEEIEKEMEKIDNDLDEKNPEIKYLNIDSNVGIKTNLFITFGASTGITMLGEAVMTNVLSETLGATVCGTLAGPIGIGIGFGVGITISLIHLLIRTFRKKTRYKEGLIDFEQKILKEWLNHEEKCLETLETITNKYIRQFNNRLSIIHLEIVNIEKEQWDEKKIKYTEQKYQIFKIIEAIK